MILWNTHQQALILAKEQNVKMHGSVCVCVCVCARSEGNRVKLDDEHWCNQVQKLAATSAQGKVTTLWNR
jgi:hypothetical protein